MTSNLTGDEIPTMTLEQWNQQELPTVAAVIVYLSTISVTGAIGNILVIYIYMTQFKRSNSKYFILCLAFTDLFSSLISHPFEIHIELKQFTFTSDITCRISRLVNCVPTLASGFIFLAIATDRYRKVCRPFGWQLTLGAAKYVCVGCFVCSAILSWPTPVLYGLKSFAVPELRGNATTCSVNDSVKGTVYPFIFNSILAFLFIFGTFFLVTMFTLIGLQLHSQFGKMAKKSHPMELKSGKNPEVDDTTDESSLCGRSMTRDDRCIEGQNMRGSTAEDLSKLNHSNEHDEIQDNLPENGCTEDITDGKDPPRGNESNASADLVILDRKDAKQEGEASGKCIDYTIEPLPNESRKYAVLLQSAGDQDIESHSSAKKHRFFRSISSTRTSSSSTRNRNDYEVRKFRQYNASDESRIREKRTRRINFLMFLITLAHVLSYLPNVILMITREIKKDFVPSMSPGQRAAYLFFLRSYALNSAVNPLIYSACDKRFRIACRRTFRRLCSNRSRN